MLVLSGMLLASSLMILAFRVDGSSSGAAARIELADTEALHGYRDRGLGTPDAGAGASYDSSGGGAGLGAWESGDAQRLRVGVQWGEGVESQPMLQAHRDVRR
jgi:hypothetical protein